MKTKLFLIVAFMASVFLVGIASATPAVTYRTPIYFDVPQQILDLTNPDLVTLGSEFNKPASIRYADMKAEIKAKVKYGFGLSLTNASGQEVLLVVNGKPAYFERDGKEVGLFIMGREPGTSPIPYNWFEKYGNGDVLVIGMFPLGPNHEIKTGYVIATRFQELFAPDGSLVKLTQAIGTPVPPLAGLRPRHIVPHYDNKRMSPLIALKPGVQPLVIARNSNPGPVVPMAPLKVNPTTAGTFLLNEKQTINSWMKVSSVADLQGKQVAMVERVTEGSPYYMAGLREGMKIIRMEHQPGSDLYLTVIVTTDCGMEVEGILCVEQELIHKALEPQDRPIAAVDVSQSTNTLAVATSPEQQ